MAAPYCFPASGFIEPCSSTLPPLFCKNKPGQFFQYISTPEEMKQQTIQEGKNHDPD